MTARTLAVLAVILAAVVVVLPAPARTRLNRVLGMSSGLVRRGLVCRMTIAGPRLVDLLTRPAFVAACGGCAGLIAGGPVGAFGIAVYGALLGRGVRRYRAGRLHSQRYEEELDALCAFAADLRAGLPPAVDRSWSGDGADGSHPRQPTHPPAENRPSDLAMAAVRLAEITGAPLADLVERIEADGRASARARATAAAQAAGVRATAWLLAVLPVGGIALGYSLGVDPLRVLLTTPVGAGCAVSAVSLQVAGLAWVDRLARSPGGAPCAATR